MVSPELVRRARDLVASMETRYTHDDVAEPPTPLEPLVAPDGQIVYLFARSLVMTSEAVEHVRWTLEEPVQIGIRLVRPNMLIGPLDDDFARVLTVHQDLLEQLTLCTMIAACREPWSPKKAVAALENTFGDADSRDGSFYQRRVRTFTDGGTLNINALMKTMAEVTDTISIVGHAPSTQRMGARMRDLEAVSEAFPWLLNVGLIIDPENLKSFTRDTGHNLSRWAKHVAPIGPYDPDSSDAVADLVKKIQPVREAMLTAHTPEAIVDLAGLLAEIRCAADFPYRPFVHQFVDHFKDRLRGADLAADLRSVCRSNATAISKLDVTAAHIRRMEAAVEALEQQDAQRSATAEVLERASKALEHQLEIARRGRAKAEKELGDLQHQMDELRAELELARKAARRPGRD